MIRGDYDSLRQAIRPGDIIAFGGEGFVSALIKLATGRCPVSHVGIVFRTEVSGGMWQNRVLESTTLDGFSGVVSTRLSQRLRDYRGRVWWLPLSAEARARGDWPRTEKWLLAQEGKPYARREAALSALDLLERVPLIGKLFRNPDRHARLFCSQLAGGGLKEGGVLPPEINPAELTPRDLVVMRLYAACVQLKGSGREIPGFNTLEPETFS
ncbi:MAG: hypothetical protein GX410_01125 [Elusimicrobia bacterium]|nr:hypothetical protein [Elusimicrobiota bacterium]